jgi:hypothetical protein
MGMNEIILQTLKTKLLGGKCLGLVGTEGTPASQCYIAGRSDLIDPMESRSEGYCAKLLEEIPCPGTPTQGIVADIV